MDRIHVKTSYNTYMNGDRDTEAIDAVGRLPDFSGQFMPTGERDLGWTCASRAEADGISRALSGIGLTPTVEAISFGAPARDPA